MDGKIQILPYNTAALAETAHERGISRMEGYSYRRHSCGSRHRGRADVRGQRMRQVGDNVINIAGGTWDGTNYFGRPFTSIEYEGFPAIPSKNLPIIPHDAGDYGGDYHILISSGERCPFRGGAGTMARHGVWCAHHYTRARAHRIGLRPAFLRTAA